MRFPACVAPGEVQRRSFDEIGQASSFGSLRKREFDSIDHSSAFGGLKRSVAQHRRAFDELGGGFHGFASVGEKRFDSIDHSSEFGGLRKRALDALAYDGRWKRAFGPTDHISGTFARPDKIPVDFIGATGAFRSQRQKSFVKSDDSARRGIGAYALNSVDNKSNDFNKKSLDSIDHSSVFGGLEKKEPEASDSDFAFGHANDA